MTYLPAVQGVPWGGGPDHHLCVVLVIIQREADLDSRVGNILVVQASLKVGQGSGAARRVWHHL